MRIKTVIFTLTTLILGSCNTVTDLTEEEVYSIINNIIKDDSLEHNRVCWEFQSIELVDKYKEEFTKQDIIFIDRQNKMFKNLKVKPNRLKWFNRGGNTFDITTIDSACNQGILYHISFPLISADRQKVIIEFEEDCNCSLGGHGGKDLYKKRNGHWVKIKGFDHWISDNRKMERQKHYRKLRVSCGSSDKVAVFC